MIRELEIEPALQVTRVRMTGRGTIGLASISATAARSGASDQNKQYLRPLPASESSATRPRGPAR